MQLLINDNIKKLIPLLFDGSPKTIITEILQNCRRAGATRVDVSLGQDAGRLQMEVNDNGCGMDRQEIQNLLSLTGSGWTTETVMAEVPAGMGFLSLSGSKEVIVRTTKNGVSLSFTLLPGHFNGEAVLDDVTDIRESAARRKDGTNLIIRRELGKAERWNEELECALPLCGIKNVFFNNVRIDPVDYLEGCTAVKDYPEFGLRIGSSFENPKYTIKEPYVNFYGIRLSIPGYNHGPFGCSIRLDVYRPSHIKMVLPARNAVHSDLPVELEKIIKQACFEAIMLHGKHSLSFKDYSELKASHPELPEAVASLMTSDTAADYSNHGSNEIVVNDTTLLMELDRWEDESDGIPVAYHKASEFLKLPVCDECDAKMKGYSWYDALDRITDARFELVRNGEVMTVWTGPPLVDSIKCIYTITKQDSSTYEVSIDLDQVGFTYSIQSWCDDVDAFHTSAVTPSLALVEELKNDIMQCYFSYSEDGDTYETQENDYSECCHTYLTASLISKEEVLRQKVVEAFSNGLFGADFERYVLSSIKVEKIPGRDIVIVSNAASIQYVKIDGDDGEVHNYSELPVTSIGGVAVVEAEEMTGWKNELKRINRLQLIKSEVPTHKQIVEILELAGIEYHLVGGDFIIERKNIIC